MYVRPITINLNLYICFLVWKGSKDFGLSFGDLCFTVVSWPIIRIGEGDVQTRIIDNTFSPNRVLKSYEKACKNAYGTLFKKHFAKKLVICCLWKRSTLKKVISLHFRKRKMTFETFLLTNNQELVQKTLDWQTSLFF